MTTFLTDKIRREYGKLYFEDVELTEFEFNGRKFSVAEVAFHMTNVDDLLKRKNYGRLFEYESEKGLPNSFVNWNISREIVETARRKGGGDGEALVERFKDRGYTLEWLDFMLGKKGKVKNLGGEE